MGPPYIPPPEPVWVVIDPALLAPPDSAVATGAERAGPRGGPEEAALRRRAVPAGAANPSLFPCARETADPNRETPEHLIRFMPSTPGRPWSRSIWIPKIGPSSPGGPAESPAADSLARLAGDRVPSPRKPDKLDTAQGLMRQAREAIQRGDIRAAANLAYKARLLAAEVP